MRVALLAGGTGAAKLAVGLQAVLGPGELSVVTNTADDVDFWGLRVCPDTDSVLFRLAGIFNEQAGFGVAEETFNVHGQMRRLGEPDWFWLGDRDLAFHLVRTDLLRRGARLTETALELGRRLGLSTRVLPMADDDVRTCF
ncbi:MAG TPA: 2-phospho-L-lactate transferase CofD family protein, partial [Candidatus Eisenbacteria bacterium]|nr:2-phospho-L-lactate transferase CofD family protein [Candidatus Eisenbacteria bacterium]